MTVRRAKLTDLRRIASLDHLARASKERRTWLRQSIRERVVWVLLVGSVIKAYAILTRSFFQRPFIEMLYVASDDRRHGLGERLLARLETEGLRDGEVWTSTNQSNRAMRRLLKKRDFVQRGSVTGLDRGDAEMFFSK